ncbi:glycogen-binding domain-containing protein [Thermodesulfobacteriota bacterium]
MVERIKESDFAFEPPSLLFSDVPVHSEQVFRFQSPIRGVPQLGILGVNGRWSRYPMVRELGNRFYTALRLAPGEHLYNFTVGGHRLADPSNPGEIVLTEGGPASVIKVSDRSETVKIANHGSEPICGSVRALSDQLEVPPGEIGLPAHGEVSVIVRPKAHQMSHGSVESGIALIDSEGRTLSLCPVTIRGTATVPSLSFQRVSQIHGARGTTALGLRVTGPGRITCHILDRVEPNIRVVTLENSASDGCCWYRYEFSDKAKGFRLPEHFPATVVMSDSPFPEQRTLNFRLGLRRQP